MQDQSNLATQESSGLGAIDYGTVVEAVKYTKSNKRKLYQRWTDNDRYRIGKYAAENGYASEVFFIFIYKQIYTLYSQYKNKKVLKLGETKTKTQNERYNATDKRQCSRKAPW